MNAIITNNGSLCAQALEALREVMDPEIGLNIVDLGLVYQLDFNEEGKQLFLSMTLTTQFCPMGQSIQDGAENALQMAFPSYEIHVHLVFDPPWNADRISEDGKEFLNS